MGKKGFYHLFSDGFRTDVLFEDKPAFVAAMNIIAICCFRCKVTILAFCLMDNHVHFILYGTLEECGKFRDKFLQRYGIWHSNRYSSKVLETIAYVLRNSIAAGYGYCVYDYPWSSGGLYFRHPDIMEAITAGWESISDLSLREQFRRFQTQKRLPAEWKVTPDGYLWPGNYVDFTLVQKLFKTPKSFTFFMGQGKEEEINRSLGIEAAAELPEIELRENATALCLKLFKTSNMRRLDITKRLVLGKELRKIY